MPTELRPMHPSFGAEVVGVDLTRDLDGPTVAAVEAAWTRYSILLFRDVRMTPAQHVAFTRRLGPLHVMEPLEFNLPTHPEVFVVSNVEEDGRPVGLTRAGWGWHSDGEDKAIPNDGSFLYALEIPPEGGDTLFADTYAAFAALPADIRRTIAGRRACFSRVRLHHVHYPHLGPLTDEQKANRPDVWHPIARRHPRSGWTALYIGRWACQVEGLPEDEARDLIRYLQEFATRPEVVYRHRWRVGDAVLWDNRCTQHCATEFDDVRYRRRMHRTTLEGEPPLLADRPVPRPARA
ncbi:MAG TPA: TauD/TfdA family dioxygenase [Methylomirabilota bacterium]|nr:TauD/TfdA family dioxygenase [Methylomirabilota bacterium]